MEVIAKTLSQFASGAKYEDLPGDIVQCAKERIIDILSAAMAGSSLWEYRNKIIDTSRNMGDSGYSTIIGRKETASFPTAAAINCAYAHSVELDDGHRNAGTHAGAVVIPTALSLAEKFNIGGRRVILAVVIGYDVAYRFARIMSPLLIEKRFSPVRSLRDDGGRGCLRFDFAAECMSGRKRVVPIGSVCFRPHGGDPLRAVF